MDWVTALFALTPTILLLAQTNSCLRRPNAPPYVRRFGVLCGLLSGWSFVLYLLLASGTLVLNSEFGIVMVQGPLARFGMAVLLIGSALGVGLGLYVCGLEAGRLTRLSWLLGPGLVIGFLATGRLLPLNTGDVESFRIYVYDLWWPPLFIYLSACLVESALSIVRWHHKPIRLWVATALIAGLALLALSQPKFGDPTSAVLWQSCLLLLLPASMSMVTWLFFRIPRQRLTHAQWWIRQGLTVLPAAIGLLGGISWVWGRPLSSLTTPWSWLLWLCWPILVGLVTPHQLSRAWQAGRVNWPALPRPTFQQSLALAAIAVLALSLAILVSLVSRDWTLALAGFVMAWILLAEAVTRGPLSRVLQYLIDRQQWSDTGRRVSHRGRSLGAWVGALLSVPSMPVLVGKTLVGVAILVALNELPNAHKTLIQPFKVLNVSPERDEVGRAISEEVVNTLGLLQEELRQTVILASQLDAGDDTGRKKFALMPISDSTDTSPALGKSTEIEIGGVKIPLDMFFAPLRTPIRGLLGVRVINGSVQVEERGYALLASSDAGETWKLMVSRDELSPSSIPISPEVSARFAAELAFHIIKSDEVLAPVMTNSWAAFKPFKEGLKEWRKFETKQDYGALTATIAHFRAATQTDPEFAAAYYRLGLALQADGNPTAAVKVLRASLKADPHLVPARIALASSLSAEAHITAEPQNLVPHFIALTPTLYSFERIDNNFLELYGLTQERERAEEAQALWRELLHLPRRGDWGASVTIYGAAYYGLCSQAYQQGRKQPRLLALHRNIQGHDIAPNQWHHMAYYYCKRAETLFASLSAKRGANAEVKKGEAYVLYTLGLILANFQQPRKRFEDDQPSWECWETKLEANLNSREGLQYFRRASDLLPDDYRIRCYAARAAYALGDPRPLERLEADPTAHLNLADSHRHLARVCASIEHLSPAGYIRLEQTSYRRYVQLCNAKNGSFKSVEHYQWALDEYDQVIRRDPESIEALAGYTSTVWERLIHAGYSKDLRGWIGYYAEQALSHARKAAVLSLNPSVRRWRVCHAPMLVQCD
jgi:tetratricopeptide (TPR) repeat protein